MFNLLITDSYEKRASSFLKKHPTIKLQYKKVLELLILNPYHPSLRLHKVSKLYSISVNMQYRIIIDLKIEENTIIPINIR